MITLPRFVSILGFVSFAKLLCVFHSFPIGLFSCCSYCLIDLNGYGVFLTRYLSTNLLCFSRIITCLCFLSNLLDASIPATVLNLIPRFAGAFSPAQVPQPGNVVSIFCSPSAPSNSLFSSTNSSITLSFSKAFWTIDFCCSDISNLSISSTLKDSTTLSDSTSQSTQGLSFASSADETSDGDCDK
eukprot:NODE_303_length_10328_cov_1.228077.p7 type:complete len:186 gc:universal NODE_303_length_10328_cov_1.228077:812-255(-)